MLVRNRVVTLMGLKNLGHPGEINPVKPANEYRVGDRVGIFPCCMSLTTKCSLAIRTDIQTSGYWCADTPKWAVIQVRVSNFVHFKNTLGHCYKLFVALLHRLVVPAMLARALPAARDA